MGRFLRAVERGRGKTGPPFTATSRKNARTGRAVDRGAAGFRDSDVRDGPALAARRRFAQRNAHETREDASLFPATCEGVVIRPAGANAHGEEAAD